jgi:hypothetical protein
VLVNDVLLLLLRGRSRFSMGSKGIHGVVIENAFFYGKNVAYCRCAHGKQISNLTV